MRSKAVEKRVGLEKRGIAGTSRGVLDLPMPSIVHNELRHVAGLPGADVLAGLDLDVPRIRIWG